MSLPDLFSYLGLAGLFAVVPTVLSWAVLWGRRVASPLLKTLAIYPVFFFLVLSQYPLPARSQVDCSGGGVAPILKPLATFDHLARVYQTSAGLLDLLGNKVLQAAGMNFLLFVVIGLSFLYLLGRPAAALFAAFLVSLAAEVAQLTGLLGIYPCPYRYFEADDLLLNTSGAAVALLIARLAGCFLVVRQRPSA